MKRRNRRNTIALTLAAICTAAGTIRGDSLWQKRNPQRAFLCQDSRARNVGDLVTIVVTESSEVDNSEDKSMSKSSGNSVKSDFEASSGGGLGTQESAERIGRDAEPEARGGASRIGWRCPSASVHPA